MSRLRHPIRAIREPFGKAGLTVAVIALVFAMVGGAFAAAGLNGKQKKQVKAIAKSFQGTGPAGANGTNGAPGEKGAKGDPGTNGTNGTNGTDGDDGDSVTGVALDPGEGPPGEECVEGGVEYTSASGVDVVCNGEEGSPWTAGGTLPEGETETGTWSFAQTTADAPVWPGEIGEPYAIIPLSFSIPLPAPLGVGKEHYIAPNGKEVKYGAFGEVVEVTQINCVGSASSPSAAQGHLCVYGTSVTNATITSQNIVTPGKSPATVEGELAGWIGSGDPEPGSTGTSGAAVYALESVEAPGNVKFHGSGTWAVTAP